MINLKTEKMKILVLTYFKEANPGTFLQAFGVQYALRKILPQAEIEYVNVGPVMKESKELSPENLKRTLRERLIQYASLLMRKQKHAKLVKQNFKQTSEILNFFGESPDKIERLFNQYDCILIGSDTILESVSIAGEIGIMWPSPQITAKKIYFAASAGSCRDNYEKPDFFSELHHRITDFSYIGLRDEVTIDFFVKHLGIDSEMVVKQPDPTFYLPLSLFHLPRKYAKHLENKDNIIFYHLDRRFKFRKELAELLKNRGYFLISPEYDPTADISMYALNPFEWGALFEYCDYVITERFHDTVFGMRYAKPIIPINWGDTYTNANGESKLLSVARDFGIDSNYISIRTHNEIFKVTDKLDSLENSENKHSSQECLEKISAKADLILNEIETIIQG